MSAFEIIDQQPTNTSWNGSPQTLSVNENIVMPQTPNGTTILIAENEDTQNSQGDLSLTSGGNPPVFLRIPALAHQPTVVQKNWGANNLSITNISVNNSTTIQVQAVGPGIPGITPEALEIGTPLTLAAGDVAQGTASPQYMQLVVQNTSATLGILGIIGGLPNDDGTNGYVIAVNHPENTGPGTGKTPPPGYYATTTSNTYQFSYNWGSSSVFVANLSPQTAHDLSVTMRNL